MKLCTHTISILPIPVKEQLKIIKKHEFDSVMLFWHKDLFETSPKVFAEEARSLGLEIENVHIPFWGAETLWDDTLAGDDTFKMILNCMDDCRSLEIKKAVVHPSGWKTTSPINEVGLNRFKRIIERAEKHDLIIALENISDTKVLDYLYDSIPSDKLKFCYDNGHEHIFSKSENLLLKYKDKLAGLHLTDNDGIDDHHELPFNGNYDWTKLIKTLRDIDYKGPLSFEVGWQLGHDDPKYSYDQYANEIKQRAFKILNL